MEGFSKRLFSNEEKLVTLLFYDAASDNRIDVFQAVIVNVFQKDNLLPY